MVVTNTGVEPWGHCGSGHGVLNFTRAQKVKRSQMPSYGWPPALFPVFIRIPPSQLPLKGFLSEAHSCPSLCVSKRVAESTEAGSLKRLA